MSDHLKGPRVDSNGSRVMLHTPVDGLPEVFYALCWQQIPGGLTACDRMAGHAGPHTWHVLVDMDGGAE